VAEGVSETVMLLGDVAEGAVNIGRCTDCPYDSDYYCLGSSCPKRESTSEGGSDKGEN